MYQKQVSSQFRRDIKKYKYKDLVIAELKWIIELIVKWTILPQKNKDHELKWTFKWLRECHVFPDLLLIYEIEKQNNILYLVRVGSHSELFW